MYTYCSIMGVIRQGLEGVLPGLSPAPPQGDSRIAPTVSVVGRGGAPALHSLVPPTAIEL